MKIDAYIYSKDYFPVTEIEPDVSRYLGEENYEKQSEPCMVQGMIKESFFGLLKKMESGNVLHLLNMLMMFVSNVESKYNLAI